MTTNKPFKELKSVAIGETLWDLIGSEQRLGGAPFNFAYHMSRLGIQSSLITRIGKDDLGALASRRAEDLGMSTRHFQRDSNSATGTVHVELGGGGNAAYEFAPDAAWDHLQFTDADHELVGLADIVYFGTLAQRSSDSRNAVTTAIANAQPNAICVLDLNLRALHYTEEVISQSLRMADIVKMNEDELALLQNKFNLPADTSSAFGHLAREFNINIIALTKGAQGAEAQNREGRHALAAPISTVQTDSIGSGDAFTAFFAAHLAAGSGLEEALRYANLAGAYVASQPNATPEISMEVLKSFERESR